MRNKPSSGDDERAATTADEDARDQTAVREMTISLRPDERDAVERAVRDLVAVGLLNQEGSRVFPTRAAVAFHDLYEA